MGATEVGCGGAVGWVRAVVGTTGGAALAPTVTSGAVTSRSVSATGVPGDVGGDVGWDAGCDGVAGGAVAGASLAAGAESTSSGSVSPAEVARIASRTSSTVSVASQIQVATPRNGPRHQARRGAGGLGDGDGAGEDEAGAGRLGAGAGASGSTGDIACGV